MMKLIFIVATVLVCGGMAYRIAAEVTTNSKKINIPSLIIKCLEMAAMIFLLWYKVF